LILRQLRPRFASPIEKAEALNRRGNLEDAMPQRVEKFTGSDLAVLHLRLMEAAEEQRQGSAVLAAFLKRRGYGVDSALVADVALRLDDEEFPMEQIQAELERVALVM
jgi:hypothetical protein